MAFGNLLFYLKLNPKARMIFNILVYLHIISLFKQILLHLEFFRILLLLKRFGINQNIHRIKSLSVLTPYTVFKCLISISIILKLFEPVENYWSHFSTTVFKRQDVSFLDILNSWWHSTSKSYVEANAHLMSDSFFTGIEMKWFHCWNFEFSTLHSTL